MSSLPFLLVLLIHSAQNPEPDLTSVIHRATEYVTKYEAELGNLIGTEKYVQTATPLNPAASNSYLHVSDALATTRIFANGMTLEAIRNPRITMTTSSDFMLIK